MTAPTNRDLHTCERRRARLPAMRRAGAFPRRGEARVHVLRGVSLRLERGFVHAVVGPSGCGKSTLLIHPRVARPARRRSAAHQRPGRVRAARRRTFPPAQRTLLGFIFQFHFLLQDFTRAGKHHDPHAPARPAGRRGDAQTRRATCSMRSGWATRFTVPAVTSAAASNSAWPSPARWRTIPQVILADEPTGNLDTANSNRVFSSADRPRAPSGQGAPAGDAQSRRLPRRATGFTR